MTEENVADAKQNGWEGWATRTTAILAVLAALSSGRWGASNLRAILEQGKVNDAWSYYQAKSIKQHAAEQTRDLTKALTPGAGSDKSALDQLRQRLDADARREAREKQEQEADARRFEKIRDRMVEGSFWYEVSFGALQLGVILCTIASGAKRKWAWIGGIAAGTVGLLLLINGFYHFWHADRSWYENTSQEMTYEVPTSGPVTAPAEPSGGR